MKVKWNEEKENIEKLIKEGVSYERIGRQYGVTGASVKKAAKKLGIELEQKREINPSEHFNKGVHKTHVCQNPKCGKVFYHRDNGSYNKFCCMSCQHEYEYIEYIKRWKNGEEDGIRGKYDVSNHIRRYLFEKYDGKCQICGWNEENPITHKIPLQVHHIDGNCLNNKEENLQLLCPNCHSLSETFGSLNENSSRIFRKQKNNI